MEFGGSVGVNTKLPPNHQINKLSPTPLIFRLSFGSVKGWSTFIWEEKFIDLRAPSSDTKDHLAFPLLL